MNAMSHRPPLCRTLSPPPPPPSHTLRTAVNTTHNQHDTQIPEMQSVQSTQEIFAAEVKPQTIDATSNGDNRHSHLTASSKTRKNQIHPSHINNKTRADVHSHWIIPSWPRNAIIPHQIYRPVGTDLLRTFECSIRPERKRDLHRQTIRTGHKSECKPLRNDSI